MFGSDKIEELKSRVGDLERNVHILIKQNEHLLRAVKLLADHVGVKFRITQKKDAEVVLEKVKRGRK